MSERIPLMYSSAIALSLLTSQTKLFTALQRSNDFVTYVPAFYGPVWTTHEQDIYHDHIPAGYGLAVDNPLGRLIDHRNRFEAIRAGLTIVSTGMFDDYLFDGVLGADVKANSVSLMAGSEDQSIPIT